MGPTFCLTRYSRYIKYKKYVQTGHLFIIHRWTVWWNVLIRLLKSLLRRFVMQEQKHWASLLPYLLFSVREVPQSSTGFSPFELLYGRQPRSILDLLRVGWEEHKGSSKNVVKHVLLLRDRLDLVGHLAQDKLRSAQHRQQQHYNKNALIRTF
ncbi:UNVERIFIED_CONTAM: hypothetical protein FKN15_070947 [Acipenser sinensis]